MHSAEIVYRQIETIASALPKAAGQIYESAVQRLQSSDIRIEDECYRPVQVIGSTCAKQTHLQRTEGLSI